MKPARLLRWYPREWRERYGEELLALIQDTLDEGQPTWRLRLGAIRGGLRERGHQAVRAGAAAVKRLAGVADPWWTMLAAGVIFAYLPGILMTSPPPARGWQAAAAFDAVLAAVALTGAVVLANGLAALPALVRFLRAGGWPKIGCRVAWAAGATAVAGGALGALVLISDSRPPAQLDASWAYLAGFIATGLAMAVAIGLWATAAAATARHLTLTPRVRAVQLVLGALGATMVTVMFATLNFWWSATQSPVWLLVGLVTLALASMTAWRQIPRAVRRGRRVRAAASGATIVNPGAQRTHGRHRA
jgi:hypothetical protein